MTISFHVIVNFLSQNTKIANRQSNVIKICYINF